MSPPGRQTWLALVGSAALGLYHLRLWRGEAAAADARRRGRKAPAQGLPRHPKVTILVAAWNEREGIERHLASVRALRYPSLEYVLVAGGSDGTYERAESLLAGTEALLLRQEPGEGKQRALRRGWARASGEIVYLTDADCELTDQALEGLVAPIAAGAGAATGRCQPFPEELRAHPGLLFQWASEYVAQTRLGATSPGLQGGNCAVSRDALERAGAFDADVRTGTDYHLARALARTGVTIAYASDSVVSTEMPHEVGAYMRRQSRWLRNHWIHGRTTGDRAAQAHALRTWGIGAALLGLALAGVLFSRPLLLLWWLLVLHGSLARARYAAFLARAEGLRLHAANLLVAPAWFLIDAASWLRSLVDTLVPNRRGAW